MSFVGRQFESRLSSHVYTFYYCACESLLSATINRQTDVHVHTCPFNPPVVFGSK